MSKTLPCSKCGLPIEVDEDVVRASHASRPWCKVAKLNAELTAERERADIAEAERDVLRSNQLGPVPEGPLKALGAWVADHTDDDTWLAAERYLNAALAELTAERERVDALQKWLHASLAELRAERRMRAGLQAQVDGLVRAMDAVLTCPAIVDRDTSAEWSCCGTESAISIAHAAMAAAKGAE